MFLIRIKRFHKKNHFDSLKKEEFCIASKGLKVFVKENGTTSSRLGISISSKHANAVNRNKFKRRIKEAVRGLETEQNVDIYVIGTVQSSKMNLTDITETLISHPELKK